MHVWYSRQPEICLREKHFVREVGAGEYAGRGSVQGNHSVCACACVCAFVLEPLEMKCSSLRLLEAPAQQSTFPATPPLHHPQNCLPGTENGPARKGWIPADGTFLHLAKRAIFKLFFFLQKLALKEKKNNS